MALLLLLEVVLPRREIKAVREARDGMSGMRNVLRGTRIDGCKKHWDGHNARI